MFVTCSSVYSSFLHQRSCLIYYLIHKVISGMDEGFKFHPNTDQKVVGSNLRMLKVIHEGPSSQQHPQLLSYMLGLNSHFVCN